MAPDTEHSAVFLDGRSNRKRSVALRFAGGLDIVEQRRRRRELALRRRSAAPTARRRLLRLSCATALPLARLEIADAATQECDRGVLQVARCRPRLRRGRPGASCSGRWRRSARSSCWRSSAFRSRPTGSRRWCPSAIEQRIGEAVDKQVHFLFGGKTCDGADGQAAFDDAGRQAQARRRHRDAARRARAVVARSECVRAAGRKDLSARRAAAEGEKRRRGRRRARPRARARAASRQPAQDHPDRRHVVPDRAAVRRRHRRRRDGVRRPLAVRCLLFARRGARAPMRSRSRSCTSSAVRPSRWASSWFA